MAYSTVRSILGLLSPLSIRVQVLQAQRHRMIQEFRMTMIEVGDERIMGERNRCMYLFGLYNNTATIFLPKPGTRMKGYDLAGLAKKTE